MIAKGKVDETKEESPMMVAVVRVLWTMDIATPTAPKEIQMLLLWWDFAKHREDGSIAAGIRAKTFAAKSGRFIRLFCESSARIVNGARTK